MPKKSQAVMSDLIISVIIIGILALFLFVVFTRYSSVIHQRIELSELEITTIQVLDSLIETTGVPANWENEPLNVQTIGLASYDRNLSKSKIKAFLDTEDEFFKEKFRIKRYDFYFGVKEPKKDETGEITEEIIVDDFVNELGQIESIPFEKMGCRPSNRAKNIVDVRRKSLYNGEIVIVELLLWPVGDSIC